MRKLMIGALVSVMLSLGAMAGNVKHTEDTCPCSVFLKGHERASAEKSELCEKAQDYKFEAEKALETFSTSNTKEVKDVEYKLYRKLYTKYQNIMKSLFN